MKTSFATVFATAAICSVLSGFSVLAQSKGAVAPAAEQEEQVSHVPADQVAQALANSGRMVAGKDHTVIGAHRNAGAGQPEAHMNVTDIYYIVDGEATFVTGGEYTDYRETSPGERIGGTLTGGTERQLKTGDVIVIPPGIPHWYKDVPNEISYYLVKVIRP